MNTRLCLAPGNSLSRGQQLGTQQLALFSLSLAISVYANAAAAATAAPEPSFASDLCTIHEDGIIDPSLFSADSGTGMNCC